MTVPLRIALLSIAFTLPVAAQAAEARKAMRPQERAMLETSQKFSARLSRLDALMGTVPRAAAPRARSANAEH